MLAIWSLVALPFLKPDWTSGSSQLLKPGLENFEHYFASKWDECNCAVVCVSISLHYSECRQKPTWIIIGRTDAEAPILWPPVVKNGLIRKDLDIGKDWRQDGKGDGRGWDVWMASPTQWTWVWASSRRWWRTEKPGCSPWMAKSQRRLSNWTTATTF